MKDCTVKKTLNTSKINSVKFLKIRFKLITNSEKLGWPVKCILNKMLSFRNLCINILLTILILFSPAEYSPSLNISTNLLLLFSSLRLHVANFY